MRNAKGRDEKTENRFVANGLRNHGMGGSNN